MKTGFIEQMSREDLANLSGERSTEDVLQQFAPLLVGDASLPEIGLSASGAAERRTASPGRTFDAIVLPAKADGQPLAARIREACTALRPGGRLVLVADNALALGTLSAGGMGPERGGEDGGTTRAALTALLAGHGLTHQDWWYPFPDARAPLTILAERALARPSGFDPGTLAMEAAASDRDGIVPGRRWAQVAEAGLLADLAPAFAVAASTAPLPPDHRLALHFGLRRRPGFERIATFAADGAAVRVTRTPRHPGLPARVEGIANLFPDEDYVPGRTWQAHLVDRLAGGGWHLDAVTAWARMWRDAVSTAFAAGTILVPGTPLPGQALDAIPRNLIFADRPRFIDLEWELGRPLDAGHLTLRALVNALTEAGAALPPAPAPSLLEALQVLLPALGLVMDEAALAERFARESRFQSIASGCAVVRDLAWAAATRPGLPEPLAGPIEVGRLLRENAALHGALAAERAARAEAEVEGARRTDRVIAYAADLDRQRAALDTALAEAGRRETERLASRGGARLRRLARRCLPGRA